MGKIQQCLFALLFLVAPAGAQTVHQMVDAVSGSAIFSTIAGLQGFGSRYYLGGNGAQVSKWLRDEFIAAGVTDVTFDSFLYSNTSQLNVVATLPGIRSPGKEIIVGGHIDSRSTPVTNAPGADDDASGTAAVLEIARVLVSSGYHPSTTIRFIGFQAEEAGLVGSGHYADEAKAGDRDIIFMLNFDMIGYNSASNPNRYFYVINYSNDSETAGLITETVSTYTSLKPVITSQYQANVDSYSFAVNGFKALSCMEYLFNPYYHSTGDVIGVLDSSYVRDIVRAGLVALLTADGAVTSVEPRGGNKPVVAELEQNWPNPFNPTTTVRYSVGGVVAPSGAFSSGAKGPAPNNVKLIVYDVLGRQVAILVDEVKAPGSYEVRFDGSGLSSGVYYYRLTSGEFAQTRAMMLVK